MFYEIKEVVMNHKKFSQLPEDTAVRVESLPDRAVLFNNRVTGGSMGIPLDPGEYTAVFTYTDKEDPKHNCSHLPQYGGTSGF